MIEYHSVHCLKRSNPERRRRITHGTSIPSIHNTDTYALVRVRSNPKVTQEIDGNEVKRHGNQFLKFPFPHHQACIFLHISFVIFPTFLSPISIATCSELI